MSLLSVLRRWGLAEETDAQRDIRALEAERDQLRATLAAETENNDVTILQQHVAPWHARRAEQEREFSNACTPYLDVWNEKGHQASAIHAMQKAIQDQIGQIDEMLKDRYDTYAAKSKYIQAANVVFSSMADRVHAGVPFPRELQAWRNLPAPQDDTQDLMLNTLERVSAKGAPTLGSLREVFGKLTDAFDKSAPAEDPAAGEIRAQLADIQQKLARSEISECINAVEAVSDEVSLYPGNAPGILRYWHRAASDYSVAHQAIHFLGANLHAQKFAMVEPYLHMQMKELGIGEDAGPRGTRAA